MTTILSTGNKLYADRRATISGGVIRKMMHGTGRPDIKIDFSKKIYIPSKGVVLPLTSDRSFLEIGEDAPLPTVKAMTAAGNGEIFRIICNAVVAHADKEGGNTLSGLMGIIGDSRIDSLDSFSVYAALSDGRTGHATVTKGASETKCVLTGDVYDTGVIRMTGSGARYHHPEMNYPAELAKDLFIACSYLDKDSSINYQVYDLASDTLTSQTPANEEIQESLTKVGMGGLWMGSKAVFNFSDKQ